MKQYFDKAFSKIAVLGSGTMGGQIAAHFANLGFEVIMFDVSEEVLAKSLAVLKKLKPTPLASQSVIDLIRTSTYESMDILAQCDFIIESVVENLDIKKQITEIKKVKKQKLLVGAAVGAGPKEFDRSKAIIKEGVDLIVVDTAHGHTKKVGEIIKFIKKLKNNNLRSKTIFNIIK